MVTQVKCRAYKLWFEMKFALIFMPTADHLKVYFNTNLCRNKYLRHKKKNKNKTHSFPGF